MTHTQRNLVATLLLIGAAITSLIFVSRAFAVIPSSAWQNAHEAPKVIDGDALTQDEYNELLTGNRGAHGRQNCTNKSISLGGIYNDTQVDCWYGTEIGEISSYGYMFRPKGSDYAGFVNGVESRLVPTHNKDMYIEFVPAEVGGFEVHFRNTEATEMRPSDTEWEYPVFYEWVRQPTKILKDAQNNPYIIDDNAEFTQIWYSENGQWMLVWDRQGYVIRINLQTLDILTLQARLPSDGADWFASLDISPDGGQVAVNIYGQSFRLVDADLCKEHETTHVTDPKSCGLKFLSPDISKASGQETGYGYYGIFKDDTTLEFYTPGQNDEVWSYYVFAPGTYSEDTHYVALGDSYASGEGAYTYFKGTDDPNNMCHLSDRSYPYLLGKKLRMDSVRSVACSGARIQHVSSKDEKIAQQYNSLPSYGNSLEDWLPGYKRQSDYINKGKPNIATISIGGNDIGFGAIIKRCVVGGDTCFETFEDRIELMMAINHKFDALVDTFKEVRSSSPGSRVYVIGYPKILNPSGRCNSDNVHFNQDEKEFSEELTSYLNTIIHRAATRGGVKYVSTERALEGVMLCDKTPLGVHGITLRATKDKARILKTESFHPTAIGHIYLAKAIQEGTDDLSASMKRPVTSMKPPEITDNHDLLKDAPRTGRAVRKIYSAEDVVKEVKIGDYLKLGVQGIGGWFKEKSPVSLWVHSDPQYIGDYVINQDEELQIKLPDNLTPGMHTIHMYGEDPSGELVDVQQVLFVYASEDDWNGDGILNTEEGCQIFPVITDPSQGVCEIDVNDQAVDSAITGTFHNGRQVKSSATEMYKRQTLASSEKGTKYEQNTPLPKTVRSADENNSAVIPNNNKRIYTTIVGIIITAAAIASVILYKHKRNKTQA